MKHDKYLRKWQIFVTGRTRGLISKHNTRYTIINSVIRLAGNSITAGPTANYNHYATSLGNWQNIPVAVGSYYSHRHVESFENGFWSTQPDFPFVIYYIFHYSMVSVNGNLFLFGGNGDGESSDGAAKYYGKSWIEVGTLLERRQGHRQCGTNSGSLNPFLIELSMSHGKKCPLFYFFVLL